MRALSVVLLLVVAAPALADTEAPAPPAAPAPPEAPPAPVIPPSTTPPIADLTEDDLEAPAETYGYRLQIGIADGAAIAMSLVIDQIADSGERPGALATLTVASYFFTAPLLHGVHRQGRRALLSFALRAGLPLALGMLGEQLDSLPPCDSCDDTLRSDGKLIGLTAGVLIAMAVDNVLLARPIHRRVERPRAAWAPAVRGARGGATAGIFGTF